MGESFRVYEDDQLHNVSDFKKSDDAMYEE